MGHGTPIKLTLYGPSDEVISEYSRTIVPWKILKRAVRLSKELDETDLKEADLDSLAQLVVDFYGNAFGLEDLENGADVAELLSVLQAIIAKASAIAAPVGTTNPTTG